MSELTPQPGENVQTGKEGVAAPAGINILPDVVLEARYKPDGTLVWNVPADLIKAVFLLKILELAVTNKLDSSLSAAQKEQINKEPIIIPKRKLFGFGGK